MTERNLGFDLRVSGESRYGNEWTDERRNRYLIRTDVALPLSVDRAVWPSVFSYENSANDSDPSRTVIVPSDFHEQALRLVADLRKLEQLRTSSGGSVGTCTVCITLVDDGSASSDEWWAMAFAESTNPALHPDWKFMGYDIADRYFTSGMSNCGYAPNYISEVRTEWCRDVNECGLIDSLDRALVFRTFSDKRVPAHSPFCVFGIYTAPSRSETR